MKSFLPIFLVATLLLAGPATLHAKKKKGKAAQEEPAAPPEGNPAIPAEALAPYINNIDGILALHRQVNKSNELLFTQAGGRMITLRQQFLGEMDAAPDDKKAKFKAAVATCDLISAALDERQKVLADLGSSQAVAGGGKLEAPAKKDNLTQGIHGTGTAKAVGAIVERDRERQAVAQGKAHAAANDNALTAMAANRWTQRSIEWRQKIVGAYTQIR
jgi:hypothetical protein